MASGVMDSSTVADTAAASHYEQLLRLSCPQAHVQPDLQMLFAVAPGVPPASQPRWTPPKCSRGCSEGKKSNGCQCSSQ